MSHTIKPADNSQELHSLVAAQLQRHNLRIRPGATVTSLISDLKAAGLELKAEYGTLVGDVSGQVANLPAALENFAAKNADKFFPRDISTGITGRDQMDRTAKSEFIKTHGLRAYEQLPARAADAGPVELDPATITRAEYSRLPSKIKVECIRQWGTGAIQQIMSRTK